MKPSIRIQEIREKIKNSMTSEDSWLQAILDYLDEQYEAEKIVKNVISCPPHDMQDYYFTGAWGGSMPPPTKQCSKCLLTM